MFDNKTANPEEYEYLGKYHLCNYCEHFRPGNFSRSDDRRGVCHRSDCYPSIGVYSTNFLWTRGCITNFKHTIHNHFNVESPEYIEEYKAAKTIEHQLNMDMFKYRCGHQIAQEIDKEILKTIVAQKIANTPETKN